MQMSTRCEGNFTTNSSVVDQISKRQDVFFLNPTTPLAFACESYIEMTVSLQDNYSTSRHDDKIAAPGEGCKPGSDRQKYVVESKLATGFQCRRQRRRINEYFQL